jgi:viroplasmin and RNaseH domain-containing protein
MAWYVVFHGRKPGVYDSWEVCSQYIVGFSGAAF